MSTRFVVFWCVVAPLVLLSGCATSSRSVNADLFKNPDDLNARLLTLQSDAKQRPISQMEALAKLGVPPDKCGPLGWDRVRDLVFGKNVQIQVREERVEELVKRQKEYTGCSFVYQRVKEEKRPSFSWAGIVGIRSDRNGPEKEIVMVFHNGEFYDAGGFGPNDVNETRTDWVWSLMGALLQNGAEQGGKEGAKKAVNIF